MEWLRGERTGDQTVPGELTPGRDNRAETETVSGCVCLEQRAEIPESSVGTGKTDVLLDLLDLELNEGGVDIVIARVKAGEDVHRSLPSASGAKPTRGLWKEHDKGDVDDGGCGLEVDGCTPGVRTSGPSKWDGNTGCEELTDVVERVEETHPSASSRRAGDLREVGLGRGGAGGTTETSEETTTDEHALVLGIGSDKRADAGRALVRLM